MKKLCFTLLLLALTLGGQAQQAAATSAPGGNGKRFFAGISYSFLSYDMQLSSMQLHSVWRGVDLGTEEKTQAEIDQLNDFVNRDTRLNALCLQVGMNFIRKPDSKWTLSGSLFGGIAENLTTVTNTLNSVKEYSFNSGFSRPCLGLGFDLGYRFTKTWGANLRLWGIGTMGTSTTITDLANPDLENYTASKENKYRSLFSKAMLCATYNIGKFSLMAGPGFYRIWSHHEYKRVYTQTEEWETITETMTTGIVTRSFIDGNVAAAWAITDWFSLNALVGIGADIQINAGLHVNF